MKIQNKLYIFLLIVVQTIVYAQPGGGTMPPPDGGQGTTGTGAVANPIDMYVYVLGIVAILMIAYFTRKYKTSKI